VVNCCPELGVEVRTEGVRPLYTPVQVGNCYVELGVEVKTEGVRPLYNTYLYKW